MKKFSSSAEAIDIRYAAHLARIRLTDEEAEAFQRQLDDVLAYIDKLREVDVTGVPPTSHPVALSNVMREDTPGESLPHETVIANAPQTGQGLIMVPRIME